MHEHALDAMLYAWLVMDEKKKEENKMEGIFLGKVDQTAFDPRCISLSFRTKHLDQHVEVRKELDYDYDYMLVKANDIIINNDELLKLRDEVKRLTDECNEWKVRYSTVNNELFQKGLAYGTLETAYKNEKIAGEMLIKDRDALKEKVANLTGQKERLRDGVIYWNNRFTSVMTDFGKVLEANGVTFAVKNIDNDGNWDVVIDIPELNEAKKKVEDLEKKLADATSKETYWRDRKEEEEDYHHYWLHTFERAVKKAAEKGIHIGICGNDEECNAGIVTLDNMKAEKLESQIATLTDSNKKLNQQVLQLEKDYQNLNQKYGAADNALEYWNNTYNDIVIAGKKVGVKINIKGKRPDSNAGFVFVTNEKVEDLERQIKRLEDDNSAKAEAVVNAKDRGDYYKGESDAIARNYRNLKKSQEKKWSAMTEALKDKGIEVIYMGEENNKPIIDVKVPAIDILKKELEGLKSRTLDKVEIRLSMGDIVWTYCDGFSHVSSNIDIGHINCLCKNYVTVDAESISCGTIPKCSSCAHYMHNAKYAHDWCHKPVSKEGPGRIRKLNKEEAEGPACSDFKARKE